MIRSTTPRRYLTNCSVCWHAYPSPLFNAFFETPLGITQAFLLGGESSKVPMKKSASRTATTASAPSPPARPRRQQADAERHAEVLDDMSEVILRYLPDGTYTYVNEAFCRLTGRTRDQLLGYSWLSQLGPEQSAVVLAKLRLITPRNPVVTLEYPITNPQGKLRWMQFINRGLFNAKGRLQETQAVGHDISELKQAQLDLIESNERWKFAVEGSGDGVWDWNVPTGQVSYSKRWKEMIGYEELEIGPDFIEWRTRLHPDDLEAALSTIGTHLSGKSDSYTNEFRMLCKDGSWKWILARGKVTQRDANGNPLRVVGTHTDISAAKAAKQREEHNLRLVATAAPLSESLDAIVTSIAAQHPGMICAVMLTDPSGTRLVPGTVSQLPLTFRTAIAEMPIKANEACSGAAAFARSRVIVEDIAKSPNWRKYRSVAKLAGLRSGWAQPIFDSTGHILGTFACYHRQPHSPTTPELQTIDQAASLTALAIQRHRSEEALRASEHSFRAIFEQAAVGVALIDTPTGRFLKVNQRMAEINRVTPEQMLKTTFMAMTHPDDLQADLDLMEKLKTGQIRNFNLEKRNVTTSGEVIWISLTVSPMWKPGETPSVHMSVVQDITASKNAEANYLRELEYNQALITHTSAYIAALNTRGEFIHLNPAFLSGLGYHAGQLIGRTPWQSGLMNKQESNRSKQRFQQLLSVGSQPAIEVRLRASHGEWHDVELRSVATRLPDGQIDRIIITGNDVTERKRLQREILNLVEGEQARLGHDLHDGVGQTMTGIISLLNALETDLSGPAQDDARRIRELLQDSVSEVRRMSHGLSPTSVKYRGLHGGLELLAETVRLNYRTPCTCEIDPAIDLNDSEIETHLFRICQEAINNALRHGKPSHVQLSLAVKNGDLILQITDDGKGSTAPQSHSPSGIGLRVMDYRANLIGATLRAGPAAGGGFVVTCRLALPVPV